MPKYKNILDVSIRTFNRRVRNSRHLECSSAQNETTPFNTVESDQMLHEQIVRVEETSISDSDCESTLSELEDEEMLSNNICRCSRVFKTLGV